MTRYVRLAAALHGALVRAVLPPDFRVRNGAALAAAFEALAEATEVRGRAAVAMLLVREFIDLLIARRRLRQAKRSHERRGRLSMWEKVRADCLGALRTCRKAPAFTAVAVATLGIGIGAATAIWTLADGVLFRPLDHRDPAALVTVSGTSSEFAGVRLPISYPNYVDLRAGEGTGLSDMAAVQGAQSVTIRTDAGPEAIRAVRLTGNAFAVLGNDALIGRTLRETDSETGAPDVAVLSESVWRSRFGGVAGVIGREIRINDRAYPIVGVMPARFGFPDPAVDIWLPLRPEQAESDRDTNYLRVIARLAPGVSYDGATAGLSAAMARLVAEYPADNAGKGVRLTPRRDDVVGDARPAMRLLLGAAILLLVLACANLANLLLARSTTRDREMAVRSALGAGRSRLMAQLVVEALVLALAGGLLGAALARGLVDVLLTLVPPDLPRTNEIALDGRALVFATVATLVSGLLSGLLPAWRSVSKDPGAALRDGVRGTGSGGRQRGLRGLVVAQLALALVLVSGGGLLVMSFLRLTHIDPGFDPAGVWVFRVVPPAARYQDPATIRTFYDGLLGDLAALPGVTEVGATWALPFSGDFASGRITVEGRPLPPGEEPMIGLIPVLGDYFAALDIPLVAGRTFDARDDAAGTPVVILNRTAATLLWPGQDAVGMRLRRGRAEEIDLPWITVVGVVGDTHREGLAEEVAPEMYWTQAQAAWARDMNVLVRTDGDPTRLASPVRQAVARHDPELALTRTGTLEDRIVDSVASPRFRTVLLAAFSVLALLLAVLGTYGVMAFVVAQRRHEIGVRMALGADRRRVLGDVLRDGLRLAAIATVFGLAGAAVASRLLAGLLFDVQPLDVPIHTAAVLLLVASALFACWLPARRAASVDPVETLRQ